MITTAAPGMRGDLISLCDSCFKDGRAYTEKMFEYAFEPDNVLVYVENSAPIAMLFMLPYRFFGAGGAITCQYIYAACTAEAYRGKGLMSELLHRANEISRERGQLLSVLVPASESLFGYYGNSGYETTFDLLETEVQGKEIESYPDPTPELADMGVDEVFNLRAKHWGNHPLTLERDHRSLTFTLSDNALFGGKSLGFEAGTGSGYALCYPREESLFVKELCCDSASVNRLLKGIHRVYRNERYVIRTPLFLPLPIGKQRRLAYGMSKITGNSGEMPLDENPYINLMHD